MLSSKDGKMIILSSPSGAGKTTLVKKISKEKNYRISISHTTREPRSNEIDGEDYFLNAKNIRTGQIISTGSKVKFDTEESQRGPQAVNVSIY